MADILAVEVEFERRSEIFRLEYATKWLDLEAMVKCYLDADLDITYLDDENEEISLNSEEELNEAKKLARKQRDVLALKATRKSCIDPPTGKSSPSQNKPVEASDIEKKVSFEKPKTHTSPGRKHSSYYSELMATAGKLRSSCKQQLTGALPQSAVKAEPPAKLGSSVDDAKVEYQTASLNTEKTLEASGVEMAIPEELVERVVRGVLEGLDGAVIDAISRKNSTDLTKGDQDKSKIYKSFCHLGITCDNCNNTIIGVRYKCGHCIDYDLCETCEAVELIHNPSHVFLKLRQPAIPGLSFKPDGRVAPLLRRPIYADENTPIGSFGNRTLEEKLARKRAKAELKRKYKEEKRRFREETRHTISPTKRERLERMAEKKVEEILQAAHAIGPPKTDRVTQPQGETVIETVGKEGEKSPMMESSKLLMRKRMDAEFVRDGNLPDDTQMQPGAMFVKSWLMKNTGPVSWSEDTKLKFLWGTMHGMTPEPVTVPHLAPGEEGLVCVEFVAPSALGQYQSHWRLAQDGEHFGHRVWCSITVCTKEDCKVGSDDYSTENQNNESATQEASSNAVAHLQTEQQDPSIPMRVSSSTEMLTAQDVLSFEMLKISENTQAEREMESEVGTLTHQTTPTPHNTPLGVTPCISPVRELDANILSRHMSQHSNVEIIEMLSEESDENGANLDVLGEKETEGFKETQDDDVETLSNSDVSDDLLDDFEVVPLPDCFDPSKPLNLERKSSVTGTQTFLSLLEPTPYIPKQDVSVSAVMSSSTIGTDVSTLSSITHSECQTFNQQCDAASSASPHSSTVGTDMVALCPTSHCEVQTDSSLSSSVSVASGDESFVHVNNSKMQKTSPSPSQKDAAVTAVASSRCVATNAGSFLNIASSVTQTESYASHDAATATAIPVTVAVATSVDALFNMAHTEAQTLSCQRDATTHATPSSSTISTDVDALFTTSQSEAQTISNTQDATTITVTPSSTTVATNVDALFNISHTHSQTTPRTLRDVTTTAQPPSVSVATDIDQLFATSRTEVHTEPLIPSQAPSPLQIVNPTVTLDTQMRSPADQSDGRILIRNFREIAYQPPKIVDITSQDDTNVDAPDVVNQAIGERDQEVFHDAVEPTVGDEPRVAGEATENENAPAADQNEEDQDPMEVLGYTAQKAMELAGGFVKQAFGQAAMSVNALLNPQPLPEQAEWPAHSSQLLSAEDQLVEMGFGNRQHNKELLKKHNGSISNCVQELLQQQDDTWHAARH
ncbi:uncharacterized protein [Asterias amurensis]|uniref:uncharacterized protein n=1 Tax=Asterias amurensis TaxID=7602 RepID=UPI003AB5946D